MSNKKNKAAGENKNRGYSFVEIIVAITLLTMIFLAANEFFFRGLEVSKMTTRHIQSAYLLEEGIESVRALRDSGWTANIHPLSTTTTYYLSWSGSLWTPTTTPQIIEGIYHRSFVIRDVFRDPVTGDISSSGDFDANTKLFVFTAEWQSRAGTSTEYVETIIGNLFLN